MGATRFDQYRSSSFRSIFTWFGLWCVALITPILAFYFLFLIDGYALLAPALIILCCGASYVLYKRNKEYVASYQERRDEAAIKIFNAVRMSNCEQSFAIFLRPFYTMDKIRATQPVMIPIQAGASMTFITVEENHLLEDAVVKAFRRTMPIVALGKPGETFGVGRILVDEDSWQKAATELMSRAALIIFQPSSRPGSLWEMNEIILHRYLNKTVFIMPPHKKPWKELTEDWELLRKSMASDGITIPEYQADGLLFSVDAKGRCIREKLRLDSAGKLLNTFIRLSSPVITGGH